MPNTPTVSVLEAKENALDDSGCYGYVCRWGKPRKEPEMQNLEEDDGEMIISKYNWRQEENRISNPGELTEAVVIYPGIFNKGAGVMLELAGVGCRMWKLERIWCSSEPTAWVSWVHVNLTRAHGFWNAQPLRSEEWACTPSLLDKTLQRVRENSCSLYESWKCLYKNESIIFKKLHDPSTSISSLYNW